MEYRQLGKSGIEVPVLTFGTATFGGVGEFFQAWGNTQVAEAGKLVDICMEAGVNMFDTADVYSDGLSEKILGEAVSRYARDKIIISTKCAFTFGERPNNQGSSRIHIMNQLEGSLKRLDTDYIDIYHMHGFDAATPVEETLRALDDMVTSGKVRYIAASNFSGWHLMKSLAISERHGWTRYIGHQVYYSLANREYEWELMPLGIDQGVGSIIWSPLAAGRLSGKYKRNEPHPADARVAQGGSPVPGNIVDENILYNVIELMEILAGETGKTIPQIALNWLLCQPTVSTVVIGARNEQQLKDNLGAADWKLSDEQLRRLDIVSETPPVYPYWHQRQNTRLNPPPKIYK